MSTRAPAPPPRSPSLSGLAVGVGAYALWGVLPVYWKLLGAFRPEAVLCFRIVHSVGFLALLLVFGGRWRGVGTLLRDRRKTALVVLCGVLITLNWYTFIWGVAHDLIVEASFGYYVGPLVTVGAGVFVLKERLTRTLGVSMALATAGVLVLGLGYGRPPWIALLLASTFAVYGVLKKQVDTDSVVGLALETLTVLPLALGGLAWMYATMGLSTTAPGDGAVALSFTTGVVTAIPLLLFGAAARRLPLSMLGFLQYISPTLQLLVGVLVYGEPFTTRHGVAFGLIWLAVAVFSLGAARARARG